MENTLPNMEKVDENYKVPNLEKGIAVLEYLSLRSAGKHCKILSRRSIYRRPRLTVF